MDIAIKNIKEEDWRLVKSEAARRDLKIGELISKIISEYKDKSKGNWNDIKWL